MKGVVIILKERCGASAAGKKETVPLFLELLKGGCIGLQSFAGENDQ